MTVAALVVECDVAHTVPVCVSGLAETHSQRPPGLPAAARCPAHLPELPLLHQRGDRPTQDRRHHAEGRGAFSHGAARRGAAAASCPTATNLLTMFFKVKLQDRLDYPH